MRTYMIVSCVIALVACKDSRLPRAIEAARCCCIVMEATDRDVYRYDDPVHCETSGGFCANAEILAMSDGECRMPEPACEPAASEP